MVRQNVTIDQSIRHKMHILRVLDTEIRDITFLRNVGIYHSSRRDALRDLNLLEGRKQNFKTHTEFS
jgi:hypothetical protein